MNNNTKDTDIQQVLKKYWGYDSFRPMQEEIIQSVISGRDTLALLPTGGGKSICFQVPAMVMDGICIVVSPLIALMKDQVEHLKRRGIKAVALYSGMSRQSISLSINNALFDPEIKFIYISPERLKTELFLVNLSKMKVSMIAVDEAHCISQWGYDFRPPYLEIAAIRKYFPTSPVLALTATATPKVVTDIQEKLCFKQNNVFQKSFLRSNLTYYVIEEEDKMNRMLRIMNRYPGSGIVYVRNRRKTREIAEYLQFQGISADYYHAGLDSTLRDRKQNEWMTGKTRVIVSTNAFGMGIDKPDVRFVIHLDIPDTLEAYFQEAGRGGRDEKAAVAIMLFDQADQKELIRNFELSFPPIATIKSVYLKLCQHFKIAIGDGKNSSFDFDMTDLVNSFQLKAVTIFNSLKFLERIGVIYLTDDLLKPSTLYIPLHCKAFENFQNTHPNYLEFTKLLLRSYSGLFANPVKINEHDIANRLNMSEQEVEKTLTELHHLNAIHYEPKSNKPKIIFLENRIDEQYLYFDVAIYQTRKEVAQKRLDSVLHFVRNNDQCRSRQLLAYFGEQQSKPCGSCDVCLKVRKASLSQPDFDEIALDAIQLMSNSKMDYKQLVIELTKKYQEEKVIKAVRWLIDQGKIDIG